MLLCRHIPILAAIVKQFIDFIPLLLFFIVYKLDPRPMEVAGHHFEFGGIYSATAMLIIDLPFVLLSLFAVALIALPLLPVALVTIAAFVLLAWRSGDVTRDATEAEREQLVHRDAAIAELASARLHLKALAAHEPAAMRLLATCLQHEMDHLNGVLFIDHLSKLKRDMLLKKLEKLRRSGRAA